MDASLHGEAGRIFLAATRLPEDQRLAYLREACSSGELLSAVRNLIEFDVSDDDALEDIPALPTAAADLDGCIGGYRLLDVIGRGGAGVVYRAEQESLSRPVALKLLPPGPSSSAGIRRLQIEARVLAMLDHPGVARVLEAGLHQTPFGERPFLAMELVHGREITAYCRERQLAYGERLGLLYDVCEATHHVHQRGILHRDLKPQNILVTEAGQPKVLDFGLARSVDITLGVTTLDGQAGALLGTLGYMAPEVFEHGVEGADVRSDVYALGVIGYELLVGRMPFRLAGLGLAEIARRVTEQPPPELGQLDPSLRGDTEAVFAKALAKDPARRYGSVQDFGRDLRALQTGEPVSARKPGRIDAAVRGLRRHVVAVSLVAGVMASLLLGLLAQRSARLETEAEVERSKALVSNLISFFNRPAGSAAGETTVRDQLGSASTFIDEALDGRPDVAASMHQVIGRIMRGLGSEAGEINDGLEHLRQSAGLFRTAFGAGDSRTVDASLALAAALLLEHQTVEARELIDQIDTVGAAALESSFELAQRRRGLDGQLARGDGREEEARRIYRELFEASWEASPGSTMTLSAGMRLGHLLSPEQALVIIESLQGADDALPSLRRELALRKRHIELSLLVAAADPEAPLLKGLEVARREAECLMNEYSSWLGPSHPRTLESICLLGSVLLDLQQWEDARVLLEQPGRLAAELRGPDNFLSLRLRGCLAQASAGLGEDAVAAEAWRALVEDYEHVYPPRPTLEQDARAGLADALLALRDKDRPDSP